MEKNNVAEMVVEETAKIGLEAVRKAGRYDGAKCVFVACAGIAAAAIVVKVCVPLCKKAYAAVKGAINGWKSEKNEREYDVIEGEVEDPEKVYPIG